MAFCIWLSLLVSFFILANFLSAFSTAFFRSICEHRFVITGSFANYTRLELEKIIDNYGGNISNSISKKTNVLIVGNNPGSKYKKALDLGIKIINEKELSKIL